MNLYNFMVNKSLNLFPKATFSFKLSLKRNYENCYGKFGWRNLYPHIFWELKKEPSIVVLRKRCSVNSQQIYRRTFMPKYDFSKAALQLYWNNISAWVFSCKFAAYFQSTFSEHLWRPATENCLGSIKSKVEVSYHFIQFG